MSVGREHLLHRPDNWRSGPRTLLRWKERTSSRAVLISTWHACIPHGALLPTHKLYFVYVCFYIVPSISLYLYLYPQAYACTWSMWEQAHIGASQEQVSGASSLLPLWVPETELRSSGLLGEHFYPRSHLTFIISNTQRWSLYAYSLHKDVYSATRREHITSFTSSICWWVLVCKSVPFEATLHPKK